MSARAPGSVLSWYSVVGVGDYNGSGTDSIPFGDIWIEQMNNGTFAGWYNVLRPRQRSKFVTCGPPPKVFIFQIQLQRLSLNRLPDR
jgi:hypothetical protein